MKTIEVSDDLFELVTAVVAKHGLPSLASFIESIPAVREERRRRVEKEIADAVDREGVPDHLSLKDRFALAIWFIHMADPVGFEKLNGLTKPEGQAVFISQSADLILRTSKSAKPQKIGDTAFFLNVQGGHADFVKMTDAICKAMGVSLSTAAMLKKRVIGPSNEDRDRELAKYA